MLGEQDNPPRMKLIEKLGAHSENGITAEDFAFAAGYGMAYHGKRIVATPIYQKFASLDARRRREVEYFIDFLVYVLEKEKESKGDN